MVSEGCIRAFPCLVGWQLPLIAVRESETIADICVVNNKRVRTKCSVAGEGAVLDSKINNFFLCDKKTVPKSEKLL